MDCTAEQLLITEYFSRSLISSYQTDRRALIYIIVYISLHLYLKIYSVYKPTLGVQIIVRRTIINFRIFSQPYFLIWDRTIINFEMNEIWTSNFWCLWKVAWSFFETFAFLASLCKCQPRATVFSVFKTSFWNQEKYILQNKAVSFF